MANENEMNNNNNNTENQESLSPEEMLQKLMRESVPKEKFDELQKQYNDFFAKVANGHFTGEEEGERELTEDEQQQRFFKAVDTLNKHKFHGSVEFMENALIVDDYLVSHGQRSAFAPSRGDITADVDILTENMNAIFRECLEQASGDNDMCSMNFAKCIDTQYKTGSRV